LIALEEGILEEALEEGILEDIFLNLSRKFRKYFWKKKKNVFIIFFDLHIINSKNQITRSKKKNRITYSKKKKSNYVLKKFLRKKKISLAFFKCYFVWTLQITINLIKLVSNSYQTSICSIYLLLIKINQF